MQIALEHLETAYKLCLETTFLRANHINLITFWGLTGVMVRDAGYIEFAERCFKMERLLQARFDTGDYYRSG